MAGNRVYIIGASGTGKTTLAKAIAARLGYPHFDSDDYFHYPTDPPYAKQRAPEERERLLSEALAPHSSWVLSGGAGTWVPAVSLDLTLAIFLSLPREIRLSRLRQRESDLYGSRILAGGDMEKIHRDFMDWTQGYEDGISEGTNTRPAHERFLAGVGRPVLRIQEPLPTEAQLELVLRALLAR